MKTIEKLQSNLSEVRKIVSEDKFDKNVCLEFIDACDENAIDLDVEIDDIKTDNDNLREEVQKLETTLEENESDSEIDCGIGVIEYIEPDNILLQSLMENLEWAVKSTSALHVTKLLESVNKHMRVS